MKKGIHPNWTEKAKVLVNGKEVMTVGSTLSEINVEIWSGNHPFYTGEEILVDTDNLVEKFNEKVANAKKTVTSKSRKRRSRLAKKEVEAASRPKTLKDMLSQLS
jgi:large subunit ribosomal protein L31